MVPSAETLEALSSALAAGRTSAVRLVEDCLARIDDPAGEGARVYLRVMAREALQEARRRDAARAAGDAAGPWAGIPVSVKDLFDLAGQVTTAGSRVLRDAPPAAADAVAVARLKAAGFIVLGRSNMTEFAFSGLGINPHHGTPLNPWERAARRIPGGSSSGAAVSVTDGMACAGLGTDTGGSCRIPAALCGITGFKPTQRRVPRDGVQPLSPTLDCVGTLAVSVRCCAALDAVLAGEAPAPLPDLPLAGLRLGVVRTLVQEDLDATVAAAFERALRLLARAGARVLEVDLAALVQLPQINAGGGFSAAESWAQHRDLIATRAAEYDPRVLARIRRGREAGAAEHDELHRRRAGLIREVAPLLATVDAMLMPTVPRVAPRLDELAADEDYARVNLLLLRNPAVVNFIDGCAVSIPMQAPGEPPAGLTLFGGAMADRRLLAVAAAAQDALARALGQAPVRPRSG